MIVTGGSVDLEGELSEVTDLQELWAWMCRVGRDTGCGEGGQLLVGLEETLWGMKVGGPDHWGSKSFDVIVVSGD